MRYSNFQLEIFGLTAAPDQKRIHLERLFRRAFADDGFVFYAPELADHHPILSASCHRRWIQTLCDRPAPGLRFRGLARRHWRCASCLKAQRGLPQAKRSEMPIELFHTFSLIFRNSLPLPGLRRFQNRIGYIIRRQTISKCRRRLFAFPIASRKSANW